MDEIKSVIGQLPPQDVAILKTLYNPEIAKQDLTENGQRMIPILDGLSVEEQQDAVDVSAEELPQPESGDVNVEISSEEVVQPNMGEEEIAEEEEEEKLNPAGNLEDFLI